MPQKRLKQSEINQLTRVAELLAEIGECFNDDAARGVSKDVTTIADKYADEKEPAAASTTEAKK